MFDDPVDGEPIGFIGLGDMGFPISQCIREAGFPVGAFDVREEALEAFEDAGGTAHDSPAAVARASLGVHIVVVSDDQAEDVVYGDDGVFAGFEDSGGGVLVVHSTLRPETVETFAEDAPEGVAVIDAAMSGGSERAGAIQLEAVTSAVVTTDAKQRYFWAVDTYPAGAEEPNLGPVFDFYADNLAPAVDAGDDVTTWLDNGSVDVALAGVVTDSDPTTSVWTVVSQPDDPNLPDAVIVDPAALDTTATLSAIGAYVLQLEAEDGEYQTADTVTINVYSDSCEAAKSLPDYVPLVGDLDEDCDVDQDDMDLLMQNWLECVALGECDPNVPDTQ